MPELRQLHDLTDQVRTPGLVRLAVVADRRRRRTAAVFAGVAACVVLVAVVAAGVVRERDTTSGPVGPGPGPSPTATFPALSAQQIRQHPDSTFSSEGDLAATASGVAARIWSVCLDECTRATEHVPGELQTALEVSDDGFETGALYALDLSENISHAVDDWYLIDTFDEGAMLVDSQGHRRRLGLGEPVPIADAAGPLVYGSSGLAYVDMQASELHAIEGRGSWDWQGAGDTWFWGTAMLVAGDGTVTSQAALWRDPDGSFGVKVLPIGDSSGGPGMLATGMAGTLAVVEHFAEPRLAHISTDYGATWQIRQVPDGVDSGGSLPADWQTWPSG